MFHFTKPTKYIFLAALAASVFCSFPARAQVPNKGEAQSGLPRVTLQAGMYQIDAQVASTDNQREIGLMFRSQMPQHEGMLFVFEQAGPQCFWMKNTLIPLSAAFVDADGTIANIEEMKAQTTDSHCSKRAVPFVLEMNQGWFAKRGLKAGSKLMGSAFKTQ
jgi:uncharacterized membrane protein (UPF0127 family)